MTAQTVNHEIQVEPLATRVALHPFLAGMNHTQLTLLTDCAVGRHFNADQIILREGEFANGFYLIETGKVGLESETGSGEPIPIQTIGAGDLLGWSWMFPPVRLAIQRARDRADDSAVFLRRDSAGILREGSLVRLRAFEADKLRDGDALAGCPQPNTVFAFQSCGT